MREHGKPGFWHLADRKAVSPVCYLYTDLLPSLCHWKTSNLKSFRSPCLFQEISPIGVFIELACRYSATLIGSSSPAPVMPSAIACVAENAVSWNAPPGSRPLSLKALTMAALDAS